MRFEDDPVREARDREVDRYGIRRDRAAIAQGYTASLMSNAKWRKVFEALDAVDEPKKPLQCGLKFVGNGEIFTVGTPMLQTPRQFVYFHRFGPVPLLSIEWFELRKDWTQAPRDGMPEKRRPQSLDAALEALEEIGKFVIEETDTGHRIVGYRMRGPQITG